MMDALSQLARIEALAYVFGNADALAMVPAAQNAANNCPAFWHRASSGNAVVGGFMAYLNETQDVQRAWELWERDFGTPCRMRNPKYLFELLPLNRAAAKSLSEAYDEVSVFHTESELLSRTYDAEGKALAAMDELRKSEGSNHPLVTALGGLDHDRIATATTALADHRAELSDKARADLREQLAGSLEQVA
jgi:hypothetical protein